MSKKITFIKGDHDPDTNPTRYDFDINLFELARMILRHRKLLIVSTLAVMFLTAGYLFLQPNLYTSTATILPSGKTNNMSALKSLVGLSGSMTAPEENSSALFPVILSSNRILDPILDKTYTFTHDGQSRTVTLPDELGVDNRDKLRTALKGITFVRADQQTGEIHIGVETRYPALSRAILTEYLARLENFNLYQRRSSARENERYLAEQLQSLNRELQTAEDNLEAFQKTNLDWAISDSPDLLKELGRLRREVETKSATYLMLVQQHEMAKLEARKDVPIISILDTPSLPTVKSGPFRRNLIILSGIIAFLMVSLTLVIRHLLSQTADGADREEFDALRDDLTRAFPRTNRLAKTIRTRLTEKIPSA